jgi:hypothetical protein
MPQAVIAVGVAVAGAVGGAAAAAYVSMSAIAAFAIGAATIVAAGMVANKLISNLYELPQIDTDQSRQRTAKSTVEPIKIIYGEALVSGALSFIGVAGEKNKDLYHSVVLAGHEVEAITDIYFDNEVIQESQINSGAAGGGNVTAGTFGPKNNKTICKVNKKLGGAGQTADADLIAAFPATVGSNHKGTGLAYIVTKWTLFKESQETWDQYSPQNIKGLVKGRKVYDYRLDTELVKPNVGNASFIAYSTNPVWCLIDYMINTDFGMSISPNKVDWDAAVIAADACDVTVSIPGGVEKRFTCNGVIFGTDNHKTNINKILSSMNGMMTYTNGKFVIRAGIYEAPTVSLNEDHLQGGISLKTSVERSDRFNTVTGTFIDPSQNHKSVEFNSVQIASALARDNNEVLTKEVQLPMTNSQYMAQRIGYKLIKQSDLQQVLIFPANLAGVQVAVGSRVNVTISELGWTNKIFICLGWTFSDSGNGGVNLTLREDASSAYDDPLVSDYNTPIALTSLPNSFYEIESPSALLATGGIQNIVLEWDNPELSRVLYIEVYASADSAWSNAQLIGTTQGTQFTHGGSNKIDPISSGDTRYYWVRARGYDFGDNAQALSDRFPNSDTSGVIATVGVVPVASTDLSVSANTVHGFGFGASASGSVTSAPAALTVSGGTSPYTYSWSHVSTSSGNTPTISSSTADNPTFTATVTSGTSSISTWEVTVTDNVSATASTYVSVSLTWFDNSGGAIP